MEAYIAYIYVLIVAIVSCLLPYNTQKKLSIILLLIMMLMCGFRAYDVGSDTHNYVRYAIDTDVSNYSWGPIYILIKNIAALFYNSQTAFLMIMAILTYVPLIVIIVKYSEYPAISVLMYIIPVAIYFNETFNIARQSIAIVFVLYAIVMVDHYKKKIAAVLIILAFFLHPYTFISIVLFFIDKIQLTKRKVLFLLVFSAIIGMGGTLSGIQEFLNLIMIATSDSSNDLVLKLGKYGDGYEIESGFSVVGQLSHILPLMALCWIGINRKTLNNIYYKMMLLGCVVTNIFVSVIFCERIASTYTIAQLLAVPYIYKTSTTFSKKIITLLLIGTALLYVYNLKGYSNLSDWTPYHSIIAEPSN